MRTRLVERWFGHGGGGASVTAKRRGNSHADGLAKVRPLPGLRVPGARSPRICLGIGDGSVHRQ